MTAGQVPAFGESPSVPSSACPCGHGDVVVEIARQSELLQRAADGDARAFGQLYDAHVDDVYRYLLAWTCDHVRARELTERVFDGAITWLPSIAQGESDLAAWLVTMARDSLIEHREAGLLGDGRMEGQAPDVFLATTRLDDAQRDVVVLRLLLGHSVAHTAHLAGYSERVVTELQYAACVGIWQILSGTPIDPPPDGDERRRPAWFEYFLDGAYADPGSDPGLSDVLAVADALRQAAPRQVPLPDDAFLAGLRARLLMGMGGELAPRARPAGTGGIAAAFAAVRERIGRHPWVTTTVAASAIGVVFGLQAAGGVSHSTCGNRPCLVSTTTAAAAPELGVGVPSVSTAPATTVFPTTSTPPSSTAAPTTRRPATTPPTTRPPTTTTAPPTTKTSHGRPSTSTTTTTAPPPTEPTTT